MADKQQSFLIQSLTTEEGGEFDLSALSSISYIETIDLSGPQMILDFNDLGSQLRDELELREGEKIIATLDDPYNEDSLGEEEWFTIVSMPTENGRLRINALQEDVYRGKIRCPVGKSRRWEKDKATLSGMFKDIFGYDVGAGGEDNIKRDYILSEGTNPCALFRRVLREHGKMCFSLRGDFQIKTLSELKEGQEPIKYSFDDNTKKYQISDYTKLYQDKVIKNMDFHYTSFDMVKGFQKSSTQRSLSEDIDKVDSKLDFDLPTRIVANSDQAILDFLSDIRNVPLPVIDLTMMGNGSLKPGTLIDIVWNLWDKDRPIDESLPKSVMVGTVTHWYSSSRYWCKVRGIKV